MILSCDLFLRVFHCVKRRKEARINRWTSHSIAWISDENLPSIIKRLCNLSLLSTLSFYWQLIVWAIPIPFLNLVIYLGDYKDVRSDGCGMNPFHGMMTQRKATVLAKHSFSKRFLRFRGVSDESWRSILNTMKLFLWLKETTKVKLMSFASVNIIP